MTLTIVAMTNEEEFIEFLDPELCTIEETIEYGGLRTLTLDYKFRDAQEDKEYFRIGNKIWVQGDVNVDDCLYVINTEVQQDIFNENSFTCEMEEVLVELNYAPLFSQTELTSAVDDDDNPIFRLVTNNGKQEVYVDWNSLNYWFGDYFNIGTVQECISEYASRISITGTVNRMNLLRQIEEETGNIFITRYEKDTIDNTIHRYLDFLNPINTNKNWMLNLEYDFANIPDPICIDKDGNETTEDDPWNVIRYKNDTIPDESRTETDDPPADEDDYDEEVDEPYDYESNEVYDYEQPKQYKKVYNIDPDNCEFRVTDKNLDLINDLSWNAGEVGMTSDDDPSYAITLQRKGNEIGVSVNQKSYCVVGVGGVAKAFISELRDEGEITIADDDERAYNPIPDDSYLIMYDTRNELVLFKTQLNLEIGHVHEEILDFGFNLENIVYNVDETDTYTAVSPVIQPNDVGGSGKELSRNDISTIINRWINLSVSKGDIVPMIVEKVNITATSWSNAVAQLGTYNLSSNYWRRPLKPTDNLDSTDKQYEFFRAIAYWRAPFTKHSGQMHVETEKRQNIEYTDIYTRPDTRREKERNVTPKTANTETSDEDTWAIYNQVCQYLKEHETPKIELDLDVANLQGHEYNNYDLHDKIYVKLPNTNELITTRVTKTTKEAHDIAKNSIEINNYRAVNTIKTLTHETLIEAENTGFVYPNSKTLRVRLVNMSPDTETDQYPSNKLLTFSLYKLENGSRSFAGKTYTKLTNGLGYAYINMKYDPGDYEIDISFGGDEIFEESEATININVGGVKEVPKTPAQTNTNAGKTNTGKTNTGKTNNGKTNNGKTNKKWKWKKVTTYYDKYGRSPDKKTILAIGKRSAGRDPNNGGFWQQEFKNKCPHCGKASLAWGIFWAGNEYSNYGKFPATGNGEGSSAEGAIFCTN